MLCPGSPTPSEQINGITSKKKWAEETTPCSPHANASEGVSADLHMAPNGHNVMGNGNLPIRGALRKLSILN